MAMLRKENQSPAASVCRKNRLLRRPGNREKDGSRAAPPFSTRWGCSEKWDRSGEGRNASCFTGCGFDRQLDRAALRGLIERIRP